MLLFALSLLFGSMNANAQQAEAVADSIRWEAGIIPIKSKGGDPDPLIEWKRNSFWVENSGFLYFVEIEGKFLSKVTEATLNSKPLVIQDDGSFNMYFGFPNEQKSFTITARDENNKLHRVEYRVVHAEQIEYPELNIEDKEIAHNWRFSLGTGITLLSYRQSRVTSFNEWAATVKGSVGYQIIPNVIDAGFSAFYNALPLATNSSRSYKIQYMGANLRLGYKLITAPSSFRVNLNTGIYFNTSITSSPIGFGNMIGPQLYPEFIYIFNNGNSLMLYTKFSPAIGSGGSISFSDNRELAIGTHYSFPINKTNRLSVGVDVSQLKTSVGTNWGITNTYSLSAGLSF